mmetsp:Transcript_91203/g.260977  ORF Transcript_91203/g.260977 Transcript_91203/m.260977 type:complete len:325 (-) Transcript_91203:806-1780(-)
MEYGPLAGRPPPAPTGARTRTFDAVARAGSPHCGGLRRSAGLTTAAGRSSPGSPKLRPCRARRYRAGSGRPPAAAALALQNRVLLKCCDFDERRLGHVVVPIVARLAAFHRGQAALPRRFRGSPDVHFVEHVVGSDNLMGWHGLHAHRDVVRHELCQRDNAQHGRDYNEQPGKTQHAVEPSHSEQDQNAMRINNHIFRVPRHSLLFELFGGALLDVIRVRVLRSAVQPVPKGPPRAHVRIHCVHHKHCARFPQRLVVGVQRLVQVEPGKGQERVEVEDVARGDGENAAFGDAAEARAFVLVRDEERRVGQVAVAIANQALDGLA